jgi:DNA-binding transcriptional ArsR family regulator
VFAALASPARRQLLGLLLDRGPLPVQELASHFAMRRPSVSEHLKVLKDAGLVIDRREGNRRIYQLNPDGVGALRSYLDQFWNQALTAYKAAVEQRQKEVR